MSIKKTLAISVLCFSTWAQASSICGDPLEVVCDQTKLLRQEREAYVSKLKAEIINSASKNAAPRIEEMKRQIKPIHFIKRFIQSYKIKNQEIMREAKRRVGDLETVVTKPENVAKLKRYMNMAIEQSAFNEADKATFKSNVNSIIVGNFADFIERTGLEDSVLAQFLSNACGSDGMVDNAFATTLKGERYVLICPGFLITLKQTATEEERFNSILHAISHEMAHHIDNSKVGNESYKPFLTCIANNYSDEFNRTKSDEKLCKNKDTSKEKCQMQVSISHAGELIADQWGLAASAIYAREQAYSFDQGERMLVDSWAKLCSTGDEGIHPSGDFRIATLMRKNVSISEILACGPSRDVRPACGFEGEMSTF